MGGYITNPDDAKVLRPDFTCRLPAVYWPRNAAVRFDSAIHDTFRFKVRGCFLHDASFYSAAGAEQRSCDASEPKTGLGYVAPSPSTVGVVQLKDVVTGENVVVDPVTTGQTRVVLADMHISGTAGSYFNIRHFGKPERAAVLRELAKRLGLRP